jgi:CO dehydrogenase maturation factor
VKIAFVGKGGSGKTTLSSLYIRYLAGRELPVVAIDADINQHLGVALGLDERQAAMVPALGERLPEIKEYLRGDNPRISSAPAMVKTTPPGSGSRLLRVLGDDPIHTGMAVDAAGARLMVTGPFNDQDLGVSCYHSKTGAVELYLNHLVDGPGEYVVVDTTAGAESFASGLFTRFDLTFLVAEPTRKGVSVYRQWTDYAAEFDVAVKVIGNKVQTDTDVDYLREHVGDDLLGWFTYSPAVRAMEQGRPFHLDDLHNHERDLLKLLHHSADQQTKNWAKYTRQATEFHTKNALAWANRTSGEDLTTQIDPDFILGPHTLAPTR